MRFLAAACAALALAAAPAGAASTDSLAPPDAPPHWLPPEPWVYNHWLPYDEGRLYRLLRIDRQALWQQLRDDRRNVAQLAARRGHRDPEALAARLVAPRAGKVGRRQLAVLRERALRTITQGHLAQHVFFHSLHQFAIPSAAPDIFGVTDMAFRSLRRQELSPLAIGRLRGRSPGYVQGASIAVLRERVRAGVAEGAMSAAQGRLLLRRQLTQLPRWLDQARYNGPPLTRGGKLVAAPRDYASSPVISGDGRYVAYEAYRQNVPLAVKLGEIAVLRTGLDSGRTELVSPVMPGDESGPDPVSAYHPAISGDGEVVTFESSPGNRNFAKRYGRIGVQLCDLRSHVTSEVDEPQRGADSQSAYNPALDGTGQTAFFQAVRGGRTVVLARPLAGGPARTVVAGARAGGSRFADPYEPRVSADGTRVAYTRASGRVGDLRSARSVVMVRDLRSGATRRVSPATGFSADPAISPDGRHVAFTSSAGGAVRLYLHDVASGSTVRVPSGAGRPLQPTVASGGAVVAFTSVRGATARVMAWDARSGALSVVSRASGADGATGDGFSEHPSISADGRRVVFASTATNLDPARTDGARAIHLRDLGTLATRAVSDLSAAYPEGSR